LVPESSLFKQLEKFTRFYYSTNPKEIRYPEGLGFPTPVSPPYGTDCTTFLEGLLIPVFRRELGLVWSVKKHHQFTVRDPEQPFSLEDALSDAAPRWEDTPDLNAWTIVQGWNRDFTKGHQVAIVRYDPVTDRCLILEASKANGGPSWRGVGHIRHAGCNIPENWKEKELCTWTDLKNQYPNRLLISLPIEIDSEAITGLPSSPSSSPSQLLLGSSSEE
jgi:hypothetical protein